MLIACEPDLAVVLLDEQIRLVHLNEAARRMYVAETLTDEPLEGQALANLYPPPFDDEVARLKNLLEADERPLLVRGIWRGHRVHTSVHVQPQGGYMLLGRRGEPPSQEDVPSPHLRVNAEVLDLGELGTLTPRELEVLALLGTSGTLKDAALTLQRSVKTIESHRDNIARKLGLSRRGELVRVVERSGLRLSDAGLARLIVDPPLERVASLGTASQSF